MDNKTSFSNRLRIKLQMVHEIEKDNAISKSINNVQYWYKNYLIITYSIMCSSVPLMKAAFEKCTRFSKEEKMMDELVEYYKKHIQEEMNHDE
jgi:hypothetical protein